MATSQTRDFPKQSAPDNLLRQYTAGTLMPCQVRAQSVEKSFQGYLDNLKVPWAKESSSTRIELRAWEDTSITIIGHPEQMFYDQVSQRLTTGTSKAHNVIWQRAKVGISPNKVPLIIYWGNTLMVFWCHAKLELNQRKKVFKAILKFYKSPERTSHPRHG